MIDFFFFLKNYFTTSKQNKIGAAVNRGKVWRCVTCSGLCGIMLTCRLPWWRSSTTCKPWQSGRFLPGVWERCQPLSRKGVDRTAGQGQQVVMQQEQALGDLEIPLARREAETLFQEQPETGNPYLEDALLRSYLKTHLPPKVWHACLSFCVYTLQFWLGHC